MASNLRCGSSALCLINRLCNTGQRAARQHHWTLWTVTNTTCNEVFFLFHLVTCFLLDPSWSDRCWEECNHSYNHTLKYCRNQPCWTLSHRVQELRGERVQLDRQVEGCPMTRPSQDGHWDGSTPQLLAGVDSGWSLRWLYTPVTSRGRLYTQTIGFLS